MQLYSNAKHDPSKDGPLTILPDLFRCDALTDDGWKWVNILTLAEILKAHGLLQSDTDLTAGHSDSNGELSTIVLESNNMWLRRLDANTINAWWRSQYPFLINAYDLSQKI